ncbi:hypothetical protein CFAM422_004019 [Trichoderma lentiforme]|uniref:Uncharacterized protein n=1 Tax=Trichoderma lentiforme TaxID=1567552 RepID=A0A9P5CFF7_9HYPO|nr:hypothetical protein CFAM422_004019 [Trichoderma lentiforme]
MEPWFEARKGGRDEGELSQSTREISKMDDPLRRCSLKSWPASRMGATLSPKSLEAASARSRLVLQ